KQDRQDKEVSATSRFCWFGLLIVVMTTSVASGRASPAWACFPRDDRIKHHRSTPWRHPFLRQAQRSVSTTE
ncbi:MAG: hypothetical protein J3Q66DRAFT_334331, partial [Benniella sp.]